MFVINWRGFISLIVCAFILSSCANMSSIPHAYVRPNAVVPSKNLKDNLSLGIVKSRYAGIPSKDLDESFKRTLAGNGYLFEASKYLVNMQLESVDVTWGMENFATANMHYEVMDVSSNKKVYEQTINSSGKATSKLGKPILSQQPNVESVQVQHNGPEDLALGYPEVGTPIYSNDGGARMGYAVEAAIRSSYVEFMKGLNAKIGN